LRDPELVAGDQRRKAWRRRGGDTVDGEAVSDVGENIAGDDGVERIGENAFPQVGEFVVANVIPGTAAAEILVTIEADALIGEVGDNVIADRHAGDVGEVGVSAVLNGSRRMDSYAVGVVTSFELRVVTV